MRRHLLPVLLACGARLGAAQAPDELIFQGRLGDDAGRPITAAAVPVAAEVFDAPAGGNSVFGPELHAAAVVNGVLDLRVGSLSAGLGAALRTGPDRWLQLTVNGTPLAQRQRLAAVPFALTLAPGAVGERELINASITAQELAPGAVTGPKIAAGQVSNGHINDVAWGKISGRPSSLGSPAVALGGAVVEVAASTVNFLSPFSLSVPTAGRVDVGLDASSVTLKGNAFNAAGALALLDAAGALPAAQLWGAYPGLTGLGTVVVGTWTASTVGILNGGTGAATAAGARAGLLAASSATLISAGAGLAGGGTLAGGWSIRVDTAAVAGGCSEPAQKLLWSTTTLRLQCGVDADTSTVTMGGDVTGSQGANTVEGIRGRPLASTAPVDGDLLRWDGSFWRASPDLSSLSGGGTMGSLVRWASVFPSSAVLGNSLISDGGSSASVAGALVATGGISGGNVTSGVNPGHTHSAYSPAGHSHDASQVTSGFLPSARGGTGISSNNLPQPLAYAYLNSYWGGGHLFATMPPDDLRDRIGAAHADHTHGNLLTLSGTDNYIGRFNDPSNIQASLLYQDDAGNVGLGTTSPAARFHMRGTGDPMVLAETTSQENNNYSLFSYGSKTGLNVSVPASGGGTFKGIRAVKHGVQAIGPWNFAGLFSVTNADHTIGLHGSAGGGGGGAASYGAWASSDGHTTYEVPISGVSRSPAGPNVGLYGEATGAGTNYGIYATASGGASNLAGFFNERVHVQGALSKTGGTFDIPHPDPARNAAGWRLRHSFVESPTRGDNLYRWTVEVKGGRGAVALPAYFRHLNEDVRIWVFPRDHAGRAYGELKGNTLAVLGDSDGAYNVIAVGTRKDPGAREGFDGKGVEYRAEGGRP